jgi:hypothetical protein
VIILARTWPAAGTWLLLTFLGTYVLPYVAYCIFLLEKIGLWNKCSRSSRVLRCYTTFWFKGNLSICCWCNQLRIQSHSWSWWNHRLFKISTRTPCCRIYVTLHTRKFTLVQFCLLLFSHFVYSSWTSSILSSSSPEDKERFTFETCPLCSSENCKWKLHKNVCTP